MAYATAVVHMKDGSEKHLDIEKEGDKFAAYVDVGGILSWLLPASNSLELKANSLHELGEALKTKYEAKKVDFIGI